MAPQPLSQTLLPGGVPCVPCVFRLPPVSFYRYLVGLCERCSVPEPSRLSSTWMEASAAAGSSECLLPLFREMPPSPPTAPGAHEAGIEYGENAPEIAADNMAAHIAAKHEVFSRDSQQSHKAAEAQKLRDELAELDIRYRASSASLDTLEREHKQLLQENHALTAALRSVHNSPSVTLVHQFVDAFTCMAPDEQAEAVSLLRKRHPSAAALFDRGAPGTASASAAPVPPPPPPAAALASPPLMPGTPEAEGGGVPVGRCKGCNASARKSSNTYPCTADQPCIRLFRGPKQASSKEHTCKFSGCSYCGPKTWADELA